MGDSICQFLNSKFPTVESLGSVDNVINELNNNVPRSNKTDGHGEPARNANISRDFLGQLKQYVEKPSQNGIDELDLLVQKYGRVPAITYAREIVVQKLVLLTEQNIRKDFVQILDEINDFEIFELKDMSESIDYDKKVELVSKVSSLRNDINKFKTSHASIDTIDIGEMYNELSAKLLKTVSTHLRDVYKASLAHQLKNWDDEQKQDRRQLNSSCKSEFKLLLDLQLNAATPDTIETFWAIDCLLHRFFNKFIYHFEGSGETNRLDKPEFAFSYTLAYLRDNLEHAKTLFASIFANSCMNDISGSFSTWVIGSALTVVRKKFEKEIPLLLESKNGYYLSHFVAEVKKFDEEVKQEFAYLPEKGKEWNGLTYELVLSKEDVWNDWLKNEKQFVNARFAEIIAMEDAFIIEEEVVEVGKTKPTKSATNLKNLLQGITVNYDSLPLKFQLSFLSEVQLKLLNFYFDTLKRGMNALKGIKSVRVDGVSTLERICRIWCSGKYMIEMMDKWSNDTIFIELWSSLNSNDSANGVEGKYDTTFFESVIRGYKKEILDKIPKLVNGYFERQLNRTMKEYFQDNLDWAFESDDTSGKSTELDFVVQALWTDLSYLRNTVSTPTFNEWKLLLSDTLASYFEKNVILVNTFSRPGSMKLERDVKQMFTSLELVQTYQGYNRLMAMIQVLREGRIDTSDTSFPLLDDTILSMLQMRRK